MVVSEDDEIVQSPRSRREQIQDVVESYKEKLMQIKGQVRQTFNEYFNIFFNIHTGTEEV